MREGAAWEDRERGGAPGETPPRGLARLEWPVQWPLQSNYTPTRALVHGHCRSVAITVHLGIG